MTFFQELTSNQTPDDRRDRVGGRPGAQDDSGHRAEPFVQPGASGWLRRYAEFSLIHCMFDGNGGALRYGVGSFEFSISFILAMIVMYDAIGVRQETGKQARVLNRLLFDDFLKLDGVVLQEKLKEYVGHTPIQVAAGAILGILIAFILDPMFI